MCCLGPWGREKCLCRISIRGKILPSTLNDPFHGTLSCTSIHCYHSRQYPKYGIGILEHKVVLRSDIDARKGTLYTYSGRKRL